MKVLTVLGIVAFVGGIMFYTQTHKKAESLCPAGQRAVLVGSGRSDKNEILVAYECERAR